MKFIEYFERSKPTGTKLLLLGGEDATLKNNLRLGFIKQNSTLQKEYSQTTNVKDLAALMEEGGFFGTRFYDVFFTGKVKNLPIWNSFFDIASASDHIMVLCFENEGGEWTDKTFQKYPGILFFYCKFPKNKREKTRLISFLLGHRKITLDNPELVTEISTRVKNSMELENLLVCLKLLLEHQPKVSSKDIKAILGNNNQEFLNAHDLIGGNINKLTEALDTNEPLQVLAFWLAVLRKFYNWLCQDTLDTVKPEKKDDDDEDEKDDGATLNKYQLREYRIAKHRYSLPLIREVLEGLNLIFQDCRVGKDELWKEKARITIQKMAIKA